VREAVKQGFTLIVTCRSPSALDDDLLALFSFDVCFYHFFKRCLKVMAQRCSRPHPLQISGDSPMPKNHFGQPATPASQLATDLSRLKVGECFLGVPWEQAREVVNVG
jgi:hypothetical protein